MLIVGLILLLLIEDVMCCLCELYFDAKNQLFKFWFFGKELMAEEIVTGCVSQLSRI